jgi:hypothetical protein
MRYCTPLAQDEFRLSSQPLRLHKYSYHFSNIFVRFTMKAFEMIYVQGGACVINVDYQEGILEDDLVTRVITGVETRSLEILDCSDSKIK